MVYFIRSVNFILHFGHPKVFETFVRTPCFQILAKNMLVIYWIYVSFLWKISLSKDEVHPFLLISDWPFTKEFIKDRVYYIYRLSDPSLVDRVFLFLDTKSSCLPSKLGKPLRSINFCIYTVLPVYTQHSHTTHRLCQGGVATCILYRGTLSKTFLLRCYGCGDMWRCGAGLKETRPLKQGIDTITVDKFYFRNQGAT